MLDGVMLLWWILTVPSFLFVAIDIWRTTPESPVLKWAFVILTAFTGPIDMPAETSTVESQPSLAVKAAVTVLTFTILGAALVIVLQVAQ